MTTRPQPESRAVTDAYRAASAALDERPSDATRSAILAAAARAVDAKPHAVSAAPARRWRIPLAAAATVLISTIAVIVAQRTQQQMPAIIAESAPPPAPARQEAAGAAKPTQPDVIAAAPEIPAAVAPAARNDAAAARSAPSRPIVAAPPRSTEFGARADVPPVAVTGRNTAADAAAVERESEGGHVTPASKIEAAAPVEQTAMPSGKATTAEDQAVTPATLGSERRDAQSRALERQAPAAAGVTASPMSKAEAPERWLARIIEMRRAGRDEEADAELKKLRELHPTLIIPETALRRTATR